MSCGMGLGSLRTAEDKVLKLVLRGDALPIPYKKSQDRKRGHSTPISNKDNPGHRSRIDDSSFSVSGSSWVTCQGQHKLWE